MARTKRTDPEPDTADATGTALALPDTPVLIAAYRDPVGMEALLQRIEADALAVAPDLSTAASRKEIASLAFKVARSKTALDKVGADLIEDARKTVDAVNAKRRDVRDRLDALKGKVRAPLDQWDANEAARVADLEDRLKDFTDDLPGRDASSDHITKVIAEIEVIPVDATWQEFEARAHAAKTGTLNVLRDLLATAKVREAEQVELARLRAEMAAREEADRQRAAQERAAAEAARVEREKAEAAERAAQAERDRAERESREREERHQRELAAADARRERELSEAAERERMAALRERERIAAEQARADAERRAREADQARREQVRRTIATALLEATSGSDEPYVNFYDLAEVIMAGRIPHVKVEM